MLLIVGAPKWLIVFSDESVFHFFKEMVHKVYCYYR